MTASTDTPVSSTLPIATYAVTPNGNRWSRRLRHVAYNALGSEPVETALVVATTYEIRLSDLSLERGRHLYSITLTPFETVDLEIFRTSRIEEDVSKQRSTEETLLTDLAASLITEKIAYTDFKATSEDDEIEITEATRSRDGVRRVLTDANEVKSGYEWTVGALNRSIEAATQRCALLSTAREDLSIGVRTSQEAGSRSVRRLTNQNPSRTLRYDYYQLMKRVRIEIVLVDLQLAILSSRGTSVDSLIDAAGRSGNERSNTLAEIRSLFASRDERETRSVKITAPQGLQFFAPKDFTELARGRLQPAIGDDSIVQLVKDIKQAAKKLESDTDVLVATPGVDVVPFIGADTACEPMEERMRALREQLLYAQVELARRQSASPPT